VLIWAMEMTDIF